MKAVAIGFTFFVIAFAVRLALVPWLQTSAPFAAFLVAIVLSTQFGGAIAGLTALALGSVASAFVFMAPSWSFALTTQSSIALLLYLASGAIVVVAVARLRRALSDVSKHDAQLALLNRELHHRIGNLMAIMQAITAQTLRYTPDPVEARTLIEGRLGALSASLAFLQPGVSSTARFDDLIERCVLPLVPAPSRLTVIGANARVPVDLVTGFALVLHELATNATKHGAWSTPEGGVTISCAVTEPFKLVWVEAGGPTLPTRPTSERFGFRLLRLALPGADVQIKMPPTGLVCEISAAHSHEA